MLCSCAVYRLSIMAGSEEVDESARSGRNHQVALAVVLQKAACLQNRHKIQAGLMKHIVVARELVVGGSWRLRMRNESAKFQIWPSPLKLIHRSKFPPDLRNSNQIYEFWGNIRRHPPITSFKIDTSSHTCRGGLNSLFRQ